MSDSEDSESDFDSDIDESTGENRDDSDGPVRVKPSQSEYADYQHLAQQIRSDSEMPESDDFMDAIIASRPRIISAALRALIAAFPLVQHATGHEVRPVIPKSHADRALNALLRARRVGTYKHRRHLLEIDWTAVNASFDQGHDERLRKALAPLRNLLDEPSSRTVTKTNVFAHRTAVLQAALSKAKRLDASMDLLVDHKRPPRQKRGRPKPKESVSKKRKLQSSAPIT